MDPVVQWVIPALVAVISAILAHAFSTIRSRAEWRRETDLLRQSLGQQAADTATALGTVTTMRREHELRFIALEKDASVLDEKSKLFVTSYELEQRLQPLVIRKDELRRRVVAIEDHVFGYNLDGAVTAPRMVVRREA